VVLIVVAAFIAVEIKGLLIGQSAEAGTEARLRQFLEGRPEVENVYKLITMQMGMTLMVAVKARMRGTSAAELVAGINAAEAALRAEFPEVQWLFFEPDLSD
jgi:hypothetical protein